MLVGYFDAIRGAAGIPLLLWKASPDPYPIATVRELAARDEVVGIKNDGDPFYAYYEVQPLGQRRPRGPRHERLRPAHVEPHVGYEKAIIPASRIRGIPEW